MQQQEESVGEFKFCSRQEYERALALVISEKRQKLKKHEREALDRRYEDLITEYLRFCDGSDG